MSTKERTIEAVLPGRFAKNGSFGGEGFPLATKDGRVYGEITRVWPEDDGLHVEARLFTTSQDRINEILSELDGKYRGVDMSTLLPGVTEDDIDGGLRRHRRPKYSIG